MFLHKKNIWFILGKFNFALLLSHFLVNLNLSVDKVVSMQFSQHRWTYVDSTFLFNLIPTLKQHWSSTLNQRNSINVVSSLFCQRWNNVDKHTSAQFSFSIKFQRWSNVGSSTLNRHNSIRVVSTLLCQRWNNADKYTSAQRSFSTKYQRWCVCCVVVRFPL